MVYSRRWPPWWGLRVDENLSILDVVSSGAIDFKLAGLLWLFMEHRASVLVAAGPSFAGKTTILHALLDFLPPDIKQVTLAGYGDDFKFLGGGPPEKTYLVTEEISNHSYEYLWGHQVVKAFELMPKGYALGGTVHARNLKEVAYVLHALGVPASLLARLDLVITLQVARGRYYDEEPVRRVDMVSTFSLTKEGLIAHLLAGRPSLDGGFVYPAEQALRDVLASKFGAACPDISAEIEDRGRFLSQLRDNGYSRAAVKKAILEFYRSRQKE
jgi:hypothetical protein